MDTVVGLGSAGCNIADAFAKYPQYKTYKIDVGLTGQNCFNFPPVSSHKECEDKCPPMEDFFKDVAGEVLFVVGGSGTISGASLKILHHLQRCRINILYIQPDSDLLSETRRLQERLVFGILQEYARSAVFEKIYLISNLQLEEILGEVPVTNYYDRLNELIVSTVHMLNIFQNIPPVVSTFSQILESARIATFGVFDVDSGKEKYFFPLDIIREKRYYYGINEGALKNDGTLFKKIKERVKESTQEKKRASYGVYETQYDANYGYVISYTSKIQLDTLMFNEYNID
tara:strand:+ start:2551 stop:3411 length:861 start_codon:yes stop_codon:yes gene_type:complete